MISSSGDGEFGLAIRPIQHEIFANYRVSRKFISMGVLFPFTNVCLVDDAIK